jgi:tRNA nucleotidyltransferase (CCA-adding enzyme)
MQIFLVGGAVRDELLGHPDKDRDFVVIGADEEQFMRSFPTAKKIGGRACIYIDGHDEYTLSAATTIQDDLTGRDLTINAFAKDEEGKIYAHPRAFADLDRKLLRPINRDNFFVDPLRVYRAARFAACYPTFSIEPSLVETMQAVGQEDLIGEVSAERVGREIVKALAGDTPGNFLRLLDQTACLTPWLAEFDHAAKIPAGPPQYHDVSVLEHTARVMDSVAGDALLGWMALCHDVGKTVTESAQWPRHHQHDVQGEKLAEAMGRRVRLPNKFITAGATAARYHMTAGRYDQLRRGTRVDLLTKLHKLRLIQALFGLVRADKGRDYEDLATRDLERILAVRLPPDLQDRGDRSGKVIRDLRAMALTRREG